MTAAGSPVRQRADRLLVERGLFESRAKAQAAIAAGLVHADGVPVRKGSDLISVEAALAAAPAHPWVSRGGVKLAAALDRSGFDPRDCVCLDVGASTGGFTEVLLARAARRVYAVDVGTGQLHPSLHGRPELVRLEQTDIRTLHALPEPPGFVTVDVSFISLAQVLPAVAALAAPAHRLLALIKPQFEAGRAHLKKGIVRDPAVQAAVCERVAAQARQLGYTVAEVFPSAIEGGDGNAEFFIAAARER